MGYLCTCARAEMPHTALLYLGNGLADCVQIWYVGWGSLTKCLPQVIDGVHLHVRTCAPLFHKCSACCFSVTVGPIALKFCYALGNPLATAYAVVTDGVSLHVRTCTPRFCISQTARSIVFKFGVWGFNSLPKCFPQVMGCVYLHVRTCRPRFCSSGTAWPIEFNFGVWVGGHELRA